MTKQCTSCGGFCGKVCQRENVAQLEQMSVVLKQRLIKIHDALCNELGDTDPCIDDDMTDEEICEEMPVFWAAKEIADLIGDAPWTDHTHPQTKKPEQGPVMLHQVYRCKIKLRSQINKEIPREKQGWWADISAGQKLLLRQAVQADIDRCSLNDSHSKDPTDYMCEPQTNGSLVSKIALEYMNPEQNVFASTTPPQRLNLTDDQLLKAFNSCEKVIDGLHAVADLATAGIKDGS
jgi:hypothetical protein